MDRAKIKYEIWQMNDDRPAGNCDYMGSVMAHDRDEAERTGRERFGIGPEQRVDVLVDEED